MDSNLLTPNNATEPDAAALVAAMRARGIRFVVYRRRGGVDVVLRPHRLVTDNDRTALHANWDAVKALVLGEWERENASPPPAETGLRGLDRTGERGPAWTPLSPSAPAVPSPARSPKPNDDDKWFDIRNGKRVPIARFDEKNTADFLAALLRSNGRRSTWEP
jgi:hypothetical protein